MKEKQILDRLKRSIDQAPIDILDKIKQQPRVKMLRHDDITRQDTRTHSLKKLISYASIVAVFFLLFFGWQYQTRLPDSYIYLDVNPSIEIVANRQDKVINLTAGNVDGERIINDLEYKGKTIYQITEDILDRMIAEGYLDEDQKFLLLSVYNKNRDKAEQQKQDIDRKIHEHLQEKDLHPIVLAQKLDNTSTIEKYAREYGISVSRMTFIRNLIILNPQLQVEALVDLSIGELVRLSQGMGLELDKIIDSTDLDKIQLQIPEELETAPKPQPDLTPQETDDHDKIISLDQARSIALSVVNGTVTDIDFDEDDLEYEVEIELGEKEYEVIIDAVTGVVLQLEIDE